MIQRLIDYIRNAGEVYPGAREDADDTQQLLNTVVETPDELRIGAQVRLVEGDARGIVTHIDGHEITVQIDGYDATNIYHRSEIEATGQ